jgi:CelD/BcsL family acetyltransferase involved in cellulose biosynthesis
LKLHFRSSTAEALPDHPAQGFDAMPPMLSAVGTTARRSSPTLLRVVEKDAPLNQDRVIDVSVDPLRDAADIEAFWKDLETRSEHSFFLSWLWIGTWLRHLPKGVKPYAVIARADDTIVGMAIVCRRRAWRLGPRSRTRWLLNETGDPKVDRLFIEYNGILADRSSADRIAAACLEALSRRLLPSDEIVLSGLGREAEVIARRIAGSADLTTEIRFADAAPWVDFAQVLRCGGDYRALLGRNTRQALSRAMRLYAERGPVEHRIMETTTDALAALDELIGLVRLRWGRNGPFSDPSFRSFHEDLIARGVPTGAVRVSRTMVGDRTIGILYNFVHQGHVFNYQSGFSYEEDSRLKPGLVSHMLSIEDSFRRGERSYDFGAGPAGHKSRLANAECTMTWVTMGKDSIERRIEAGIRRARKKLRALVERI